MVPAGLSLFLPLLPHRAQQLITLVSLNLDSCKVGYEGLLHLKGLCNLQSSVELSVPKVTGEDKIGRTPERRFDLTTILSSVLTKLEETLDIQRGITRIFNYKATAKEFVGVIQAILMAGRLLQKLVFEDTDIASSQHKTVHSSLLRRPINMVSSYAKPIHCICRSVSRGLRNISRLVKPAPELMSNDFEHITDLQDLEHLDHTRQEALDKLIDLKGSIRIFCWITARAAEIKKEFSVDRVFDQESTQEDIFQEVKPILKSVLGGHNVCILAYGQTAKLGQERTQWCGIVYQMVLIRFIL
ncbi:hypothetical protein GUJ93_ZPchr0005g14680 [Zizania palustris]|uniref:Kinesin motor domain-containing protein n=1 Tax=Zizania palustris TaxID=103762 RepID=A0A8J5SVY1_ZIZPA|nr:hypothetical protein GUJ93_ZPchr0005g14680 [Zizania palustris]